MKSMRQIIANLKKLSLVQFGVIASIFVVLMGFFLLKEEKKPEVIVEKEPVYEKGFELFDNNTWFKGEKEIQILEIRALKGQIEKDLLSFEKIKSATAILDMAPPRSMQKTKASIILSLKESKVLSASDIEAIVLHVSSAVKGLEKQMVVLSDTTGRLYSGAQKELIEAEAMRADLFSVLKSCIGQEHFVFLSNSVVIDNTVLTGSLKEELLKQFPNISFQFLPFKKKAVQVTQKVENNNFYWLFLIPIAITSLFLLFFLKRKNQTSDLTETLKEQTPDQLAELLSYTKPERAKEIILSLPEEMQEKVFESISKLESRL